MNAHTGHEVSPEVLGRFAQKQATTTEAQVVLCHLLAGCEVCRHHLRLAGWHSRARDLHPFVGNQVPAGPPAGAYHEAFAAAERAAHNALERKHLGVQQLLGELDQLSPEQQELRVRNLRRYSTPELSAAYVERSHAARFKDYREMLRNARLAVAIAEAATPIESGGSSLLSDCRARAWGQLANAHRVGSRLREAEQAFATALHHLAQGSGEPGIRAWVLDHLSSLRMFQRELDTAKVLLEEVIALNRRLSDRTGEAAALIKLGLAAIRSARPEEAVAPLHRALRLLTPRDLELLRTAVHNLAYCYLEMGEAKLAYGLIVDAEPHFQGCTDELALLRVNWQRGRIERDLGLLHAAEVRLTRVREAFMRQDLAFEVAVISLDLAEVFALQNRVPELVRTVGETIPIFRALGVVRDLLMSLVKLQEIAHNQVAAVALLREITRTVKASVPQEAA